MSKIWRFELESTVVASGLKGLSTMHWQTDLNATDDEAPASQILDNILDHFSSSGHNMSNFAATMKSQVKLTKARVREEVEPGSGDIAEVAEEVLGITGTNGSIAGDQLPPELCVWLHLGTGNASRSSRGGFHLPFQLDPALLTSTGAWDTAVMTAAPYTTLGNLVIDDINDAFGTSGLSDIKSIIYSRTRRARGLSPYTFGLTDYLFSPKVRWLSRRGTPP